MDLAAMVRLMVEEMHHQQAVGLAHLATGSAAQPGRLAREPGLVEAIGPLRDAGVSFHPGGLQLVEALMELGALGHGDAWSRPAGKQGHPDAIAPQLMAERAMNRAPEGASIEPSRLVGEAAGGGKQPTVHLGIVGGHHRGVAAVDHRWSSSCCWLKCPWRSPA